MQCLIPVYKREFLAYFRSPVAYVFIVIFLLSSIGFMFFIGNFYHTGQASLHPFFIYHPWLYLVLVPAIGMRLWAEERRSGSIELLLTLPVTLAEITLAKFLAAWTFVLVSLSLTFPVVITVNYLGSPDNGVIVAGYLGSLLMAGAYLAISCFTSALTKNQVISFILSVIICFFLVLVGWGVFTNLLVGILPVVAIDFLSNLGFMSHFISLSRGLIDSRDLIYFVSVIVIFLALNVIVIQTRKAT